MKVKGHATDAQVSSGLVLPAHKVGNDNADTEAREAVRIHGDDEVSLSNYFDARHNFYFHLLHLIHLHSAEGHLIYNRLVACAQDRNDLLHPKGDGKKEIISLTYGRAEHAMALQPLRSALVFPSFFRSCSCAHAIHGFLSRMTGESMPDSTHGVSWIELYLIYRMEGGPMPLKPRPAHQPQHAFSHQLASFKRQCRGVIARCVCSEERWKFEPNQCKTPRFLPHAITGHSPCINLAICITEDAARHLHILLIRLLRAVQPAHAHRLAALASSVRIKKLSVLRGSTLDPAILKFSSNIWVTSTHAPVPIFPSKLTHVEAAVRADPYYACPRCESKKHAADPLFHNIRDLDSAHACNICKKHIRTRSYLCACGCPWIDCNLHSKLVDHLVPLRHKRHASGGTSEYVSFSSSPIKKRRNIGSNHRGTDGPANNASFSGSDQLRERLLAQFRRRLRRDPHSDAA